MRLKHSDKKHRILTLATEKINNEIPSSSLSGKDNDHKF